MAGKRSARAGAGEKRKRISSQKGNKPRDRSQVRNKLLTVALEALDLGLRPILVNADKKPLVKWRDYQAKPPTSAELESWPWPKAAGVAVLTGVGDGIPGVDVVDFDVGHADWPGDGRELPTACVVKTPRGGLHYYVRHVEGARNSTGQLAAGVDTRAEGGYAIIPPTPGYSFELGSLADAVKAPPPEPWLAEALLNPKGAAKPSQPTAAATLPETAGPVSRETVEATVRALVGNLEQLRRAEPGEQNTTLNNTAYALGGTVCRGDVGRAEVETALYQAARDIGYVDRDREAAARATIKSGLDAGIKDAQAALDYPFTDYGNAERLVTRHGRDMRYCYERKSWYIWNGKCWAPT